MSDHQLLTALSNLYHAALVCRSFTPAQALAMLDARTLLKRRGISVRTIGEEIRVEMQAGALPTSVVADLSDKLPPELRQLWDQLSAQGVRPLDAARHMLERCQTAEEAAES